MKKHILLLLIIELALFSAENYELKLYQSLLPRLFSQNVLNVYVKDTDQIKILEHSTSFQLVANCVDADILIGKKFDSLTQECLDKPVFATTYRSFKNNKNAFGAFYWRKGRPQVQFKLKNINKYNLHLPKNLIKYAK